MKTRFIYLMVLAFLGVLYSQANAAEIRIGINSPRGELATQEEWGEFGQYLGAELGQPVIIVPLAVAKIVPAVQEGKLDFILANPIQTIILQEKHGATPLATLNTMAGPLFAGLIIAKKGSGITKSSDLKGKKVISLEHKTAAGGYLFQTYHLYQQGINPHTDCAAFVEGKKQDDLVLAVKAGLFDAAFIRTGVLEAMSAEKKISLDDFIVLDQRTDPELALIHTTIPYPEWFLSATRNADPKIADRLKNSVLALTPENAAAKKANIKGFVAALSLDNLRDAMRTLKFYPFQE